MKDPGPLLDDGATDFEAELLREARGEQPSSEALGRTLRTLGFSGAAIAASTAAVSTSAAATTVATGLKMGVLTTMAKWLSVVAVIGAGGAGIAYWAAPAKTPETPPSSASPVAAVPASTAERTEEPAPVASAEPSAEPVTSTEPAEVPPARERPSARPEPEPSGRPLAPEIALIDRARAALKANQPQVALSLLDQYRRQFGQGRLAPEANYLRIEALVAKGDRSSAQALAQKSLGDSHSPRARRVRSMLDAGASAPPK